MIVQCATFSKSLNPRDINKSVSNIRIRIRFPFQSRFWVSVSGCKLTILPDIQPANCMVIISGRDEHRSGLDRTGSGLKQILTGSGLDRNAIFLKISGSGLDRTEKILLF